MKISEYRKKKILSIGLIVLGGTFAGGLFSIIFPGSQVIASGVLSGEKAVLFGGLLGFVTSLIVSILELIVFDRIRRSRIAIHIGTKAITYAFIVILCYICIDLIIGGIETLKTDIRSYNILYSFFYAIAFLSLALFVINVNRLLGQNGLLRLLFGKYYTPRKEKRIFMFLDLSSSTSIAEKIGDIKFHSFLFDFFFDITVPILNGKGEIYKYVGDEVIIAWTMKKGMERLNCINTFFAIKQRMDEISPLYRKKYGVAPRFSAAVHCGEVIVGEMGDYKKEIAYLGDVVNTTARMQALCKRFNASLLISDHLFREMPQELNAEFGYKKIGKIKLRGKEEVVTLINVSAT